MDADDSSVQGKIVLEKNLTYSSSGVLWQLLLGS